jgi:rhodanese-related sulfurtransferase
MSFFSKLFGIKPVDYKEWVKNGAMIIDVRSVGEFKSGHIKGSVNIPLPEITSSLSKIPKNKVIIACCASGMRSGAAKGILKSKGYDVHNGGSWASLNAKI